MDPSVRRRILVALTTFVLWTMGYLAYAVSNGVRATAPAGPRVGQAAGEDPGEDAGED